MAELKNCRRCNRIFAFIAGMQVCQSCQMEEEKSFEMVSMYVRDHPGVSLNTVADELGLSFDVLMKYVREGRLQVRGPDGNSVNYCEKCGNELEAKDAHLGGRLCKSCEGGLSVDLEATRKRMAEKLEAASNQSAFLKSAKGMKKN